MKSGTVKSPVWLKPMCNGKFDRSKSGANRCKFSADLYIKINYGERFIFNGLICPNISLIIS